MATKEDEKVEDLLRGRLKILQKKEGYRFSIDAVLLASFVRAKKKETIIDLGTGCGVIPLILSWKGKGNNITGLEIDRPAAEMARRSVELNGLGEKIVIESGDLKEMGKLFPAESFDLAVSNPPYGRPNSGRINPKAEKATARHEMATSLDDFLAAAAYAVKYRGRLFIIFPAKRLADLMTGMKKRGFEPKRMRLVHSRQKESAKLVLLEGLKGGGAEMEVLAPLYIFDDEGRYTPEVEEMYS